MNEEERIYQLMSFERAARINGYSRIAGVDEAGRGPLAGPVVAAVCIIPPTIILPKINDSKKLSQRQREILFQEIMNNPSIETGIGIVEADEIDRINIYQATIQAMLKAINQLTLQPDYLLVDGLQLPHDKIPVEKIIKGDQLSQSIAAASIIAKVTRDAIMEKHHVTWPFYGFSQHKGYGTKHHRAMVLQHGPSPIHRISFRLKHPDK